MWRPGQQGKSVHVASGLDRKNGNGKPTRSSWSRIRIIIFACLNVFWRWMMNMIAVLLGFVAVAVSIRRHAPQRYGSSRKEARAQHQGKGRDI